MRIGDIYHRGNFGLSIEIFPPKTSDGDAALERTLKRLAVYQPAFFPALTARAVPRKTELWIGA